jgi:hypothetical protein
VVLLIGLHWLTNNNICELSSIVNKVCGYEPKKWLPSIKTMIFEGTPNYIQLGYMGFLLYFDYTKFKILI